MNAATPRGSTAERDPPAHAVAIVGMAGRFPGAESVKDLWHNLLAGAEAVVELGEEELRTAGVPEETLQDPAYVRAAAPLRGVDRFDAAFFGVHPREAALTDPQHRIFLECAWEALEHAGYDPADAPGKVAVIGGVARNTYHLWLLSQDPSLLLDAGEYPLMIAGEKDSAVTRTAYKLGLRGPSLNVQTACSTSAVAVHVACRSLLTGECDMALAGGGRVLVPHGVGYPYEEGGILSRDGHCRAFDADASGTVRGSGMCFLVLKRLEDALEDGDTIHSVILGSAVNNDGPEKVGFTAPSVRGQAEVIEEALAVSGANAETIGYVEAHGTGTAVGDPIEIAALTRAFRKWTGRKGFCRLGSIKTNIGHLDAGAGVAGIIKASLALDTGILPPSLHFRSPSPEIDFESSPFRVVHELTKWERDGAPRRAGVSSFGLGGTNAHIVLEEPPPPQSTDEGRPWQLVLLSARTEAALERATERLADHLSAARAPELADAAYTLQTGRRRFAFRRTFVAKDVDQAVRLLRSPKREAGVVTEESRSDDTPVAFLFPGIGSQYVGMGRDLYAREPTYRNSLDACLDLLEPEVAKELRGLVSNVHGASEGGTGMERPSFGFPALFATEYALARLLHSWGIEPRAMLGHSVGEYTAACLAGVLRLEDAVSLVAHRAEIFEKLPPGRMLSVPLTPEELREVAPEGVSLAVENLPRSSVASGPVDAIEELSRRLEATGVEARRLRVDSAPHSSLLDPHLDEFRTFVETIELRNPRTPYISNVTADWIQDGEATDPGYWVRHLRGTVRFGAGLARLLQNPDQILLEVGPGRVLTGLTRLHPERRDAQVALPTTRHPLEEGDDHAALLQVLGRMWTAGARVDWPGFHQDRRRRRVPLPSYPFERERHWLEPRRGARTTGPATAAASAPSAPAPAMADVRQESNPVEDDGSRTGADGGASIEERALAAIRAGLSDLSGLPPDRIDDHTSFLELGFESLSLTQVSIALRRELGVEVSFRETIESYTTPLALARHLASRMPQEDSSPQSGAEGGQIPAPPTGEGRHGPWRTPETGAQERLTPTQQVHLDELSSRLIERTSGSRTLTQERRRRLADPRTVEGFRRTWKDLVYPIVSVGSEGSRIRDVDGREWIDVAMGFGSVLLGHNPPFVRDAVVKQIHAGVEIGPQTPLAGEVSELVSELTGVERVAFCNTGSEAVLAGIRAARTVRGRDRIGVFSGSYHGIFDQVLGRGIDVGEGGRTVPIAPGISPKAVEDTLVLEYGREESLRRIREHADDLSVILVEPVQSRHPDLQPRDFLRRLRSLTRELDIPLLLDEMITGFRCHPGGIQGLWGIEGDIVTYGKVAGGGFPIGIVAGTDRFMDTLDGGWWQYGDDSYPQTGVTWFAGTFVRHPAALAASRAILEHLRERGAGLQEELNRRTGAFVEELNHRFGALGTPIHVETFSSLFRPNFRSHGEWSPLFHYHLRDCGVHITEGRGGFLSTAHSEEDVDQLLEAFTESAKAMARVGFFPSPEPGFAPAARSISDPMEDPESEVIPLTEAQEEIWLAARLGGSFSAAYNLPLELRLRGPLQPDRLWNALRRLVGRHDALRARFEPDGSGQRIRPEAQFDTDMVDVSDHTEEESGRIVEDLRRIEAETPFELERGPLLRARLIRVGQEDHLLQITVHHTVCDGWSLGIIAEELSALYSALDSGKGPDLPRAPSFRDYVLEEKEDASGPRAEELEAFWTREFSGNPIPVDLPADHPRRPDRDFPAARESMVLEKELYDEVQRAARHSGITPFSFLLAGYEALLHRLTGQEEVVVGVTLAGQPIRGMRSLVGHCANLLPLRAHFPGDRTFAKHASDTGRRFMDAVEHQPFTLGALVKRLRIARDPGRPTLVTAIFNMDSPIRELGFGELSAASRAAAQRFMNQDLSMNALPLPSGELKLECKYASDLFDVDTVRRWMGCYRALLWGVVTDPDRPVPSLPLLTEEERGQVIQAWRGPDRPVDAPATLHGLVRDAAERFPEGAALEWEGNSLTRSALQEQTRRLAHRLRGEDVGIGTRVGILLPRTGDMVVSLLAVLEAGGAFVPLDPSFPRSRLEFMIRDAEVPLVVTTSELRDLLPEESSSRTILLDEEKEDLKQLPVTPFSEDDPRLAGPDDPAYTIYTSGSTGRPKGVVVPHRAVTAFLRSIAIEPGLSPADRLLAVTTLSFDISILELFLPLLTGATSVIANHETSMDGRLLRDELADGRITVLQATPGTWRLLLDAGWDGTSSLRALSGGEALPPDLARELLERSDEVWNLYGPTEATVWCTRHRLRSPDDPILIGRPLENTRAYVLDGSGQPLPPGVVGELWIGGAQVALGYLNRPELTEDRFRADPFSGGPEDRMYRTGDLARWLPDGTFECFGRTDHQVKVRGFRIELGEVEAALSDLEEVQRAVAGVRPDASGESRLVAWVSFQPGSELLASEIRRRLRDTLPDYMVPSLVVELEEVPLTPNGKVDRHRLPDPLPHPGTPMDGFEEPSTEMEQLLAEIWKEALGLARVGARDNFFDLGGHSLLAMRTLMRMEERTRCRFEPRDMILGTVQQLAAGAEMQRTAGNGERVT